MTSLIPMSFENAPALDALVDYLVAAWRSEKLVALKRRRSKVIVRMILLEDRERYAEADRLAPTFARLARLVERAHLAAATARGER